MTQTRASYRTSWLPRAAIALLVGLLWQPAAQAIDLSVSGSWTEPIDNNDLQSGAGSDLVATMTSLSNETAITITNTTGSSDLWKVEVHRLDTNWDSNVRLYVRRTSDGTGSGSISGGTSFVEVTTVDGVFFTGGGNRSSIDVEMKITGLSVGVSVDTYITSVTHTVIDLAD